MPPVLTRPTPRRGPAPGCHPTSTGPALPGSHTPACGGGPCPGCTPCHPHDDTGRPLTHCTAHPRCTTHIPPTHLTCPRCVARTRGAVRRVADLTALLLPAAVESGRVDSLAAVLAGPAADPGAWSDRLVAQRRALRAAHPDPEEFHEAAGLLPEEDPDHPHAVLGRWQLMLEADPRGCYPTGGGLLSTSGAAAYLDRVLAQVAQDHNQDYPQLARDVAVCLTRVEEALAVAVRPERGAPCPACTDAGHTPAPALVLHHRHTDPTGGGDRWRCPGCRAAWDDTAYRTRVSADYLAVARRLTASQIRAQYRVPEATVRTWAARGQVTRHGRDSRGRVLYDVADVLDIRGHA